MKTKFSAWEIAAIDQGLTLLRQDWARKQETERNRIARTKDDEITVNNLCFAMQCLDALIAKINR